MRCEAMLCGGGLQTCGSRAGLSNLAAKYCMIEMNGIIKMPIKTSRSSASARAIRTPLHGHVAWTRGMVLRHTQVGWRRRRHKWRREIQRATHNAIVKKRDQPPPSSSTSSTTTFLPWLRFLARSRAFSRSFFASTCSDRAHGAAQRSSAAISRCRTRRSVIPRAEWRASASSSAECEACVAAQCHWVAAQCHTACMHV